MITHISGLLLEKKAPLLTMDVNGMGYEIHAPMSTFYQLPDIGNKITLLTHFVVREDAHLLFGFHSEQERQLFRALIKVNGVGPKLALTILSGMETDHFVQCIHSQNASSLTNIPGVGKKTAERLMIEMRDGLSHWRMSSKTEDASQDNLIDPNQTIQDAISALTTLGYKPAEAKNAVAKVHQPEHNNEQLIRLALQKIVRK
ncbi:MAG: Holliday junction branch migration protein RuvA [Gammaproteobacteria bacterium CG_4_10_14_0_8_um_filter_38_16]|nr:MAG: Holliday junction branch migration protein RuvA [Gammaproteobacteria bacterium CG_4_10_14_0_8_um_filter_38_16]PJA04305.1 MAG: Holliday junction branch migration protein RuvA [Gammaproteobacteria bacterium CG_4_10_14_0_2_um_filter_38_22]PJB10059.1 MAG: Holliday junction branch migration protein RuvA [Gammaproteobacteria bacterium CG_4_9_14_3_um_filter_38_9]